MSTREANFPCMKSSSSLDFETKPATLDVGCKGIICVHANRVLITDTKLMAFFGAENNKRCVFKSDIQCTLWTSSSWILDQSRRQLVSAAIIMMTTS